MGGRVGKAILQFKIEEPGTYRLSGWYDDGGQDIVLAVGQDFTMRLFTSILGGLSILFGSWILAGIIFIITFVKRRKAGKSVSPGGA